MNNQQIVEKHEIVSEVIHNEEQVISSAIHKEQKHGAPMLISIFVPGLGQIIKGQFLKGLLILFSPIFIFICIGIIFSLLGQLIPEQEKPPTSAILFLIGWFSYIIIYIWQLIDAYNNNK